MSKLSAKEYYDNYNGGNDFECKGDIYDFAEAYATYRSQTDAERIALVTEILGTLAPGGSIVNMAAAANEVMQGLKECAEALAAENKELREARELAGYWRRRARKDRG